MSIKGLSLYLVQVKAAIMFYNDEALRSIQEGDVLTLKSHMSGYYQILVSSVSEPREEPLDCLRVVVTSKAWRYEREEWNRLEEEMIYVLDFRTSFTNETAKERNASSPI